MLTEPCLPRYADPVRRLLVLASVAFALAACAAVTGLGDYQLASDAGGPDAATPIIAHDGEAPLPDGAIAPVIESGTPTVRIDAGDVTDVLGLEAGSPIYDVAVDDQTMVYIGGSVVAVPFDGSGPHNFGTGQQGRVEVANRSAYFVSDDKHVRRADLVTMSQTNDVLRNQPGTIACIRADPGGAKLRATIPSLKEVITFAADGTTTDTGFATTILDRPANGVVVVANNPFFTLPSAGTSDGALGQLATDTVMPLVTGMSQPQCLTSANGALWFGDATTGYLWRTTGPDFSTAEIFLTGQTGIQGISANSTDLYWTWSGGIRKTPLR
jgi:hypothetical protein